MYLGYNWSGNGYWHQFALVENPTVVWCEVQPSELSMIVETPEEDTPDSIEQIVDESNSQRKKRLAREFNAARC